MSGAREKVQQLGFWDPEVVKPRHDDITLWAHARAEDFVRQYVAFRTHWFQETFRADATTTWPTELVSKYRRAHPALGEPPTKRAALVVKRELEAVLREREPEYHPRQLPRNQRILGYADLLVYFTLDTLGVAGVRGGGSEHDAPEWYVKTHEFRLIIEAKSELPTLGELMRQVNLYREACRHVAVVAPDDRYAELLSEQGVLFVKYDSQA